MMRQSWMGTDFTNDDLVKESSIINDYIHTIAGDTMIDNRSCYIIRMIPKPEAAIVWGKLIVCIDKLDFMELHTRFYDEDGKLINTMNAFDPKIMDGRLIPSCMLPVITERITAKKIDAMEMIVRFLFRQIFFHASLINHI